MQERGQGGAQRGCCCVSSRIIVPLEAVERCRQQHMLALQHAGKRLHARVTIFEEKLPRKPRVVLGGLLGHMVDEHCMNI